MRRILFLTVFLASCSAASDATDSVAYNMIDPEAAQFREVEEKESGVVSGEVNGKNRMGAYTGFVPFYAEKDGEEWNATFITEDMSFMMETWKEKCVDGYAAMKNLEAAVTQ